MFNRKFAWHESAAVLIGGIFSLAFGGCDSSEPGTEDASVVTQTRFAGAMSGPGLETGAFELTYETSARGSRRGSLTGQLTIRRGTSPTQAPIEVAGSIDEDDFMVLQPLARSPDPLGAFSCSARLIEGRMRGDCTGQDGLRRRIDLRPDPAGALRRFCGTWVREATAARLGTWVMVVLDGDVGVAITSQSFVAAGLGRLEADRLELRLEPNGMASGVLVGDKLSGPCEMLEIGVGSFSATSTACPGG